MKRKPVKRKQKRLNITQKMIAKLCQISERTVARDVKQYNLSFQVLQTVILYVNWRTGIKPNNPFELPKPA